MALAVLVLPGAAQAERRTDVPCKGCFVDLPAASSAPAPLLVLLHGDPPAGSTTPDVAGVAALFAKPANQRSIVVFTPRCPKAEGCTLGSWWQWEKGDPTVWLEAQVSAVETLVAIDPDRIYIAGWSGGASYLGWWASALGGRFAAVAHLGGGIGPPTKACGYCSVPALFVVGDANTYHHLAVGLRDHYVGCGFETKWELHKKAGHPEEWAAVAAPGAADAILGWFLAHPRRCPVATSKLATSLPEPRAASSLSSTLAPRPVVAQVVSPAGRACACATSGPSSGVARNTLWLGPLLFAAWLGRPRRKPIK